MRSPSQSVVEVTLKDNTDSDVVIRVYGVGTGANPPFNDTSISGVSGGKVQVGKGSSTPTRQDFTIDSPFLVSPESLRNSVTKPHGYNSGLGLITIGTLISNTGDSGIITEVAYFQTWTRHSSPTSFPILLFRDVISPVNFLANDNINTTHEVLV